MVYSDTTEDQAEAEIFQEEAKKAKICIAYSKVISLDSSFQEVASAALEISQESTTLIVAFISSTSLLSSFANLADTSKFNFIVGHRLFVDLIKGNSFSLNVMSVAPSFMEMTVNDEFDRYFTSLSPSSADMMANLWFVSFWEQSYGCTIGVSCGPAQQTQHMQTYRRNPYVSSVLNTVNTVIDALNSLHAAKCQNAPGPCEDFMTTTPEEIQEEIRQTNIRTGSGSTVTSFSGMGDPSPGEYFVWRVDTSTGAQTRVRPNLPFKPLFIVFIGRFLSSCLAGMWMTPKINIFMFDKMQSLQCYSIQHGPIFSITIFTVAVFIIALFILAIFNTTNQFPRH